MDTTRDHASGTTTGALRGALRRGGVRRLGTATLLLAALALALPAHAGRGHDHHRWGGTGGWIEHHAEQLGIDSAVLAEIDQIVDASREEAEAIYAEHREAREAMRELLEQDAPDLDAVMRQAEVIGEIDIRKHKHRLATMLAIRAKLTPEQRSELRALKDEMRDHHPRGGPHGHHGDRSCGDDEPPHEPPADL